MAETIKPGYYKVRTEPGAVWWFPAPDGMRGMWAKDDELMNSAYSAGDKDESHDPFIHITYTEARAILGSFWPASWPQSEGVAESTAAPATGQAGADALSGTPSDSLRAVGRMPASIRCCTCGIDGMANAFTLAAKDATIKALQDRVRELEASNKHLQNSVMTHCGLKGEALTKALFTEDEICGQVDAIANRLAALRHQPETPVHGGGE